MRAIVFAIIFGLSCQYLRAQDTTKLTLAKVLDMAISQAIDLKIAQSQSLEQEMAFENARLAFQPQLFFGATLPNLNRSIESRPLPDGSDAFVNRSTMYNGLGLDLNYQLEQTGGLLSINSNIERLDVFATDQFEGKKTYFINPISIEYTQPLFQFNELKWQKERLSYLYAEFKERYARTREEIILEAISLFRNCYLAQQRADLSAQKIVETDALKEIKDRLFDLGQATITEILRLELDQQNNRQEQLTTALTWNNAQRALLDFVGMSRSQTVILEDPDPLQDITISWMQAIDYATQNRFVTTAQRSRMAEFEAGLKRAEKDKDIDLNLRASLGLNRSSDDFKTLLNPLLDREIFSASVRMPITGWKRYDLREKIAHEQINQEILRQEKETLDLSREAMDLVSDFDLLKQNLEIQQQSSTAADRIFSIVRQQFLSGNATHTDILVSSREREQAVLNYYNALLDIIERYYQIRRLCMYDFENDRELVGG